MKPIIILFLSGILFLSCSNSKEKNQENTKKEDNKAIVYTNPTEYNNAIVKLQSLIFESVDKLDMAINNYEPAEMDNAVMEAKINIEAAIQELKKIGPFKENSEYLNAAKLFFETHKELVNNEYSSLVELYKLPEEEFGEEENAIVDSLDNSISTKQDSSFRKFWKIQVQFGKQYLLAE
ncbi:MAG: hypothetical protein JXR58_01125 [Bacteroidales bacterium]|nr:hypothetical protein [Bacteroidales bacterium]